MRSLFFAMVFSVVFSVGCTRSKERNHSHAPVPERIDSLPIATVDVETKKQLKDLYGPMRALILSNDKSKVFEAIVTLEKYTLNENNLQNSELYSRGVLALEFKQVIDIYQYGLALIVKKGWANIEQGKRFLENYRVAVYSDCSLENDRCPYVRPLRGPYGLTALAYLLNEDFKILAQKVRRDRTSVSEIDVKLAIYNLYVAKNFSEAHSDLVGELFIKLAPVFFAAVDLGGISDYWFEKYQDDLQNALVYGGGSNNARATCDIFETLNIDQLKEGETRLKSSFLRQLVGYERSCLSEQERREKFRKLMVTAKEKAKEEIDQAGHYKELRVDPAGRRYTVNSTIAKVQQRFGARINVSDEVLYLLDQGFTGSSNRGFEELLDQYPEASLVEFVRNAEKYVLNHFLYLMQYTFEAFDRALGIAYSEYEKINNDFVQSVYDQLTNEVGDSWLKYKESSARLQGRISSVRIRLSELNRIELAETIEMLEDTKLGVNSANNMINSAVTFPIVLATSYFAGISGTGTMKINISGLRGITDKVEIKTEDPLKNYFSWEQLNYLQLLDFGFPYYNPKEFQRNVSLALAVKTGFFDTVNFKLGFTNGGIAENLPLFFSEYVDDNSHESDKTAASLNTLTKIEDKEWKKIVERCRQPIASERSIPYSDLSQFDLYIGAKSLGTNQKDFDKMAAVLEERGSASGKFKEELDRIKRVYQILRGALIESGLATESLLVKLRERVADNINNQRKILDKSLGMLAELEGERNCLVTMNKMDRFQKLLLQRKAVEYLAKVHAAMEMIREYEKSREDDGNSQVVISFLNEYSEKSEDLFAKNLVAEIVKHDVVSTVSEQLRLSGQELLTKVLELSLGPHNYNGSFGYPITDMETKTDDLKSSFLGTRGSIRGNEFTTYKFDQLLRVREELFGLKSTAGELRKFFAKDPLVLDEIGEAVADDHEILLNPNLTIESKRYQEFVRDRSSSEDSRKIHFKEDRVAFVKEGLEALFGSNEAGKQFFHWSIYINRNSPLETSMQRDLEFFTSGPLIIPNAPDEGRAVDSRCLLDAPFDQWEELEGCRRHKMSARRLLVDFIHEAELLYLDETELSPLIRRDESGNLKDETSQLAAETFLKSRYLDIHSGVGIYGRFKYYSYPEEPWKWTWFDSFLSEKLTVSKVSNSERYSSYRSLIDGVSEFKNFFKEVEDARVTEFLLPPPQSAQSVMRNYHRSKVLRRIRLVDETVTEIYRLEHELEVADLPFLALKAKDIIGLDGYSNESFVPIPVENHPSSHRQGAIMLLGGRGYELERYISTQKLEFSRFGCDLLPVSTDEDFNNDVDFFIGSEAEGSCKARAERWVDARLCVLEHQRAEEFRELGILGYGTGCEYPMGR